jgi:aromatic ring-cleaving dioxygenase
MIDPAKIESYHAHVYYNPTSRAAAASLRDAIASGFNVELGRWREQPVGPHPGPMYQVKFECAEFPRIVPWLMLNRAGLTILVHPNTGDAYLDHAENALWLGEKLKLNLEILRQTNGS